jgi:hypothetical protein
MCSWTAPVFRWSAKRRFGRQGKRDGTPARTGEVKLGCVFTQTGCDPKGYPIRDPDSTTYTAAIENAGQFGRRLYFEAWTRGWSRAEKKVVIGDGAEWIWNLAQQQFPGAIQIVDPYHARQHLWEIARLLHPVDTKRRNASIGLHQNVGSTKARSTSWLLPCARLPHPILNSPRRSVMRPTTLPTTPLA